MDDSLTSLVVIVGLIVVGALIGFIHWVLENHYYAKKYRKLNPKLQSLQEREQEVISQEKIWEEKFESYMDYFHQIAAEKTQGFPWLASAYADFFHLEDLKIAAYLKSKKHPARKASKHVSEIAAERRKAEKLYRIFKYHLEYYGKLFPWLIDFKGEDIDEIIQQVMGKGDKQEDVSKDIDHEARKFLTNAEYSKLSDVDKYQLALDRHWQKKKTKWEIGRDYERYVGYLCESKGYEVYYQGIVKGFADLGRDLIATKDNKTRIIQCKYWSKHKTIYEKHIFQLFGTTIEYFLKNKQKYESIQNNLFPDLVKQDRITGHLITSTTLSDEAKEFAKILGIQVKENLPLAEYPSIKCNVSRKNGEKIFHLPFDQQYDKTIIEKARNECFAKTVKEAMDLGFRRAYRWRGSSTDKKEGKGNVQT